MNKYSDFKIHPVAEIFPLMDEATYQHLKADIAENGQWEMIMMHDEQIIDGRNRLRACCELGIEPNIGELPIDLDPHNYAVGVNLHRRHLTTSQRSDVAGRLATLKHGANQHKKEDVQFCTSSDDAAELLNVSRRSVMAAKYVHEHGCKELNTALSSGEIPVSLCEKFAKEFTDKKEQAAIVKQGVKAMREALRPPKPKLNRSVDSDNAVDDETDSDPTPDPPTIRKTAKGTEKVSEKDKPRTQTVVAEIVEDEPKEILPEEKTLADFTFKEILEFIADSAAGDEKAVAKQLRKTADKLDPPTKFQKPDLEDCEHFFADNNGTEPEAFFDFYESKGWLVGKTSMKDWHAAARKWIRENAKGTYSNGTGQQPRLTTNQQREANTAIAFDRIRQAAADAASGNGGGYLSHGSGAADFREADA